MGVIRWRRPKRPMTASCVSFRKLRLSGCATLKPEGPMRIPGIVFIFAMLCVAAHAADVSGNWSGKTKLSVDGKVEEDPVYLSLKQTANIITGTAGPTL